MSHEEVAQAFDKARDMLESAQREHRLANNNDAAQAAHHRRLSRFDTARTLETLANVMYLLSEVKG